MSASNPFKARAALLAIGAIVGVVIACKRTPVTADPPKPGASMASETSTATAVAVAKSGSASEAGSVDLRAQAFCREFHGVAATKRATCCASAQLGTIEETECTVRLSVALERNAVELDDKAIDRCLAARKKALEGCDWVTPGSPAAPPACQGIVRGVVKADGVCQSSLECENGLHCDAAKCRPAAPVDSSCANGIDFLASALGQYAVERAHPVCAEYCNGVTHKCEAKPVLGAKCFTNAGCSEGNVCVNGACAVGAAAKAGESCKNTLCAEGLVCKAGACKARSKPGETCESDLDCEIGGCDAKKLCGKTCSHAGDLDAIKKKLSSH